MKCPHCEKLIKEDSRTGNNIRIAHRNCECYGSSFFTFQCYRCNKKFKLYIERTTRVMNVIKCADDADLSY